MTCPFCGAKMLHGYKNTKPLTEIFTCQGGGPLITNESGPCPYTGNVLTRDEIRKIEIFLLDNDMGD